MDLTSLHLFLQYGLIAVFVLGFVLFFAVAVLARDVEIIKKSPLLFFVELLLVSILPAIPILFFSISRGVEIGKAVFWTWTLSIKFAIFHIAFQLSGFYTYLFS